MAPLDWLPWESTGESTSRAQLVETPHSKNIENLRDRIGGPIALLRLGADAAGA